MDILSHTFSGMAVGAVVANQLNVSLSKKTGFIALGAIAGALPDVDVISMWSGFDSTFGSWFNLTQSGREIFSAKLWYSHHAFFHSLLAAFLWSVLIGLVLYLKNNSKQLSAQEKIKHILPFSLVFYSGYLIHILEDMPTPGGSWGGVAFWWPSSTYSGGTGNTWWWNNYDVFLIIISLLFVNLFLFFVRNKKLVRVTSIVSFMLAISLSTYQFKHRGFDFAYHKNKTPYAVCEEKSKEIQREILGERTYQFMRWIDNKIPVAF